MSISHFDSVAEQEHYLGMIKEDLTNTVEFWTKNSHDEGGIKGFHTCLDKDGNVYGDKNEKNAWLQAKQVWLYTQLHRKLDRFNNKDIYHAAVKGGEFLLKMVDRKSGKFPTIVDSDGKTVKANEGSLLGECYFAMAMAGLTNITQEQKYKDECLTMFSRVMGWAKDRNNTLEDFSTILTAAQEIRKNVGESDEKSGVNTEQIRDWCVEEIKKVSTNDVSVGLLFEAAWVLLKEATLREDQELRKFAVDNFVTAPAEAHWDEQGGGGFLHIKDTEGCPMVVGEDVKVWWPHCEALVALLVAFRDTNNPRLWELFTKVLNYTYHRFVDMDNGEWMSVVNKDGSKCPSAVKGSLWKGCFRVPRALLVLEYLLEQEVKAHHESY